MRPLLSDEGLECIARIQGLDSLQLECRFSGEGFRHLAHMPHLETLSLAYPTIGSRDFFVVAATIPHLCVVSIFHGDFSAPIDDETFNAIAALNGRLEYLSFGEWQETDVHPSIVPAIAQIKSLTWLELGNITGPLTPDMLIGLRELPYLEHLNPSHGIVPAMNRFSSRETYPVEFRSVESESAMMALLNYILTEIEGCKVRREVIRRRMRQSEIGEDFTTSQLPLGHILSKYFNVEFRGGAGQEIAFIDHNCPELRNRIRRYLSGMEIVQKTPG